MEEAITSALGESFRIESVEALGGGSISPAARVHDGQRCFFVKRAAGHDLQMFSAEAAGLAALAGTCTVRVPDVVACGGDRQQSWLVLEYIELRGAAGAAELGRKLADMHRTTADAFGWHRDNTIGSTVQYNGWQSRWIDFLRQRRLAVQLQLADERGAPPALLRKGQLLLERLPAFFTDYQPQPSLLHGDLWGGNWSSDDGGQPVLFDPAVYYGDREADLAMTELFGGFGPAFYRAYESAWPLHPGYRHRKPLYNLYHVLNHFNLFGASYGRQAEDMLDALLDQR